MFLQYIDIYISTYIYIESFICEWFWMLCCYSGWVSIHSMPSSTHLPTENSCTGCAVQLGEFLEASKPSRRWMLVSLGIEPRTSNLHTQIRRMSRRAKLCQRPNCLPLSFQIVKVIASHLVWLSLGQLWSSQIRMPTWRTLCCGIGRAYAFAVTNCGISQPAASKLLFRFVWEDMGAPKSRRSDWSAP